MKEVYQFIDNHLVLCTVGAIWFFILLIMAVCFWLCKDEVIQEWPESWNEGKEDNFNELD